MQPELKKVGVLSKFLTGKEKDLQEDNIRMHLEDIGINAGNWFDLVKDRDYWRAIVNAALKLRVT